MRHNSTVAPLAEGFGLTAAAALATIPLMATKLFPMGILSFALMATSSFAADGKSGGVKITTLEDKLRIEINGELFTEYHFKNTPHVHFYPVLGPGGLPMTRDWPMKEGVAGEEPDGHPHHRSLWYSHGAVNGI